ncbi:glycosyltransferase [Schaedlerella arabinosiphila]|uniref:Glycosyltransferase n=1 Tax=Schaedlerella arabinosiphila TaxID=2044587 RepID=A0A9X5H6H3_9FIRM|nr:glycosyltransferase [Schaedlerella arabinosiphila]KAI4443536.1 hypothetical protein C824_006072 [Schaedlerella arabinosiphila]NDO68156.1 glycosyltransferase [Schaedlerella arabinosiphila]
MAKKDNKKMRILHGMSDVAGQGSYSAHGLRDIGADATMAVWRQNPFGYEVDINLHIKKEKLHNPLYAFVSGIKMLCFAVKAAFRYDVFHFHFSNTLLPFALDLFWLRIMKKRIIMEYHGDDIRYYYNREKPYYYVYDKLVERPKRGYITNNRILKYVNTFITHDEELRKHIPNKNLFITPLRIDVDSLIPVYPDADKKKVTIVHAPSSYLFKGSKYVIEAVKELEKHYDIEFILVEKKTQKEAFEIYKKADIIIDQLFYQSYGVFAIESMSLGKPVVVYISNEIKETFPSNMPIVIANIDNLTEVVESLIIDGKRRYELGKAGRKYVENYHDYRKVAQVQLDIYNNVIEPMSTLESFEYTKKKVVKK